MSIPVMTEAVGRSEVFLAFQEELSRVAAVDRPVLIVGERGVGKELAAARLHYLSPRWRGPLTPLNCGALPPSLVESELFGHEAGAFTGAAGRRAGRFEAADGGAIFLDEVQNMPVSVQEKVLRVVEYGVFERVGSSRPVEVDVRVVAAANADLPALAAKGDFRADLLDRLAFEVLTIPPLRARGEDIVLLAHHFAGRMARELGHAGEPTLGDAALRQLAAHPWPGNVRELKNVMERTVSRAVAANAPGDGARLMLHELALDPFASPWRTAPEADTADSGCSSEGQPPVASSGAPPLGPLHEAVRELEVDMVSRALTLSRHNQKRAAALLDLTYDQFRGLYRKHKETLSGLTTNS